MTREQRGIDKRLSAGSCSDERGCGEAERETEVEDDFLGLVEVELIITAKRGNEQKERKDEQTNGKQK